MNSPKRHHYVPVLLQQNFADVDGGLWTFDRRNEAKGVWRGNSGNLLVEGHLYSHVDSDGSKDPSLERWFAELEGDAAPIIEKMISSARRGRRPCLSRKEREIWDFFLYQQWRRVPDLYSWLLSPEQHRVQIEELLAELERDGRQISRDERSALLDDAALKRMHRNLRVSTLKTGSGLVLDAVGSRGIAVVRIANPKKSFVLGSRPVVKLTLPGITHLSDPRVEMWLPVSHDVMVGLGTPDQPELLLTATPDQVRHQNVALATQSSQIIGRSKDLVRSLAKFVGSKIDVPGPASVQTLG